MNINDIQKYLLDNSSLIYSASYLCPTYLIGGSLRDLRVGNRPAYIDIVCLDNDNIIELFL